MPEDIKVPLILGRPFLSTAHAKIDVFERKIALRIGNDKIVFKSDNPTSNIIKKVYVLGLRERMELDLEARLMGEALILDRSQDLEFGDFLVLNDLNEPLELRRNQEVNDLGPTIEEGEVIDKPMVDIVKTRHDDEIIEGNDEYPRLHVLKQDGSMDLLRFTMPLLKVSAWDKLEGISYPYQRLKGSYKGVLSLGPEYIRDTKTVEWFTRRHVTVYEME
ncbi:hypothetical protein Tco_0057446 [Tanacetum coccineum]